MKICFLSCFGDLMKKDTGPVIRIYYLAKSLANLGNEMHIIIPGQTNEIKWTNNLWVHKIEGFSPLKALQLLSAVLGVQRPTSLYFHDILFVLRVFRQTLKSHIVQIEQPWATGLLIPLIVKMSRKPLIVDSHDVFQPLRTKRTWLRKILEVFMERVLYKLADLILTVSEKERELLIDYGVPEHKIAVTPNGVDTQTFSANVKPSNSARKHVKGISDNDLRVIFVGNMEYWPNQEASKVIVSQIAPAVLSQIGNVVFYMVGRGSDTMEKSSSNRIIFTGAVEDVSDYLRESDVAIAPLIHGSGTRLKILEYFSCGLPVVSTSVGVEGIDVDDGVNVIIADDLREFSNKVIELLGAEVLRKRIGQAARKLVVSKYDWREIGKNLNKIYFDKLT